MNENMFFLVIRGKLKSYNENENLINVSSILKVHITTRGCYIKKINN
jgi:hypothetical protein